MSRELAIMIEEARHLLSEFDGVSSVRYRCAESSSSDDGIVIIVTVTLAERNLGWRGGDLSEISDAVNDLAFVTQSFGYDDMKAGDTIVVERDSARVVTS